MKTARETRLSRANEQTNSYTEVYQLITLQSTTSLWIHLGLKATDVTELDKTTETFFLDQQSSRPGILELTGNDS